MKVYKNLINSIKNIIFKDSVIGKFYLNSQTNSKYSLNDILVDILYVLKTGIAWRDVRSSIKWTSVYWHFKRFTERNIFKKLYLKFRNKTIKKVNIDTLLIDSSIICNKYGINKVSRNKFYKNKKCNKISCITNDKGIPISINVNKGSVHDLHFIDFHCKDLHKIFRNNKASYLLADKAYFSSKLKTKLLTHNCNLMVPCKKNTKPLLPFNKLIYKKRINVEHLFAEIKNFRRINTRYDKIFSVYKEFIYLGFSCLLEKNC